ncbi:aldo/keto reductase, partial [candidate division KSB1 bacterium]
RRRQMDDRITRRKFLGGTLGTVGAMAVLPGSALLSGCASGEKIPHVTLGKTGLRVSRLAYGGGSRFWSEIEDEAESLRVLNLAIDLGITYLDNAHNYGPDGKSEKRFAKVLATRRAEVTLASKINSDLDYDTAMRHIEENFTWMGVDRINIMHLHALDTPEKLAKLDSKDSGLEALRKHKEDGSIGSIGFTAHTNPSNAFAALDRFDFDVCQLAVNAAHHPEGGQAGGITFEDDVLPKAKRMGMGVLAMKAMAQKDLIGAGPGKADPLDLLAYVMSLPVDVTVLGMSTMEILEADVKLAQSDLPLPADRIKEIADRVQGVEDPTLLRYVEAGYIDGVSEYPNYAMIH